MDITYPEKDEKYDNEGYMELIEQYGIDILVSEPFMRVMGQKHHIFSTVGYHSIHVAYIMLMFSRIIRMDEREIIRASLWHDTGIYDRDSFEHDMCMEHPNRSLSIAETEDILSDIQRDMIKNHMWPMSRHMPKTKEGFLITIADKWCAITEFFHLKSKKVEEILEKLHKLFTEYKNVA